MYESSVNVFYYRSETEIIEDCIGCRMPQFTILDSPNEEIEYLRKKYIEQAYKKYTYYMAHLPSGNVFKSSVFCKNDYDYMKLTSRWNLDKWKCIRIQK